MRIRKLAPTEVQVFIELIRLFKRVFQTEPPGMQPSSGLAKLLRSENFLVFVAEEDGAVVGGLTVDILRQYHRGRPWGYIRDLAVEETHQRRGIGRSLVEAVKAFGRTNGLDDIFVQADQVDDPILAFYRKTQPDGEAAVVHFYYLL